MDFCLFHIQILLRFFHLYNFFLYFLAADQLLLNIIISVFQNTIEFLRDRLPFLHGYLRDTAENRVYSGIEGLLDTLYIINETQMRLVCIDVFIGPIYVNHRVSV